MNTLTIAGKEITDYLTNKKSLKGGRFQYKCLSCGKVLTYKEWLNINDVKSNYLPQCSCYKGDDWREGRDWEVSYV